MSFLVDNPVTRFFGSVFNNMRIIGLLADDVFDYMFPPLTTSKLQKFLYLIGIYVVAAKSIGFIRNIRHWTWLYHHYGYHRSFKVDEFRNTYGKDSWAVVTGFAAGIGFSYSCELAKMGFNLVLIDFHKQRAEASERWIKQYNNKIQTKLIILDLTSNSQKIHSVIEAQTHNIDVGLLINNAGIAGGGPFQDIKLQAHISMYKLNVLSVLQMCKIFVPRMRKRYQRSGIINMSSAIGQLPSPYTGLYSATKQFIRIFSHTLHIENNDKIDVLCVKPLGVITHMMHYQKSGLFMVSPDKVVKQSFYQLGKVDSTFGAMDHKIFSSIIKGMSQETMFQQYVLAFQKAKLKR